MTFSARQLERYGLVKTHQLVLEAGRLSFQSFGGVAGSNSPSVYVWACVRLDVDEYEILYVGKAGKGVHKRCSQHSGGFTNSGTGRKNAEVLKGILNDKGAAIHVFSRESGTSEIFGQKVSLYSAEEDALCAALVPSLNRAVFPIVGETAVTDAVLETESKEISTIHAIKSLINRRFVAYEQGALDDVMAQIESYNIERRNTLLKILKFVENQVVSERHNAKLVRGYTGQLPDLNGVTLLGYGLIGDNGRMLPRQWVARVFFAEEPTLVFPRDRLCARALDRVRKNETTFSPLDIETFLANPKEFLQSEA